MHAYYHFVRKTRRFSLIVLINACLLAVMFWGAKSYLLDEESEHIVFVVVAVIELILLSIAIYLWAIDQQIEIRVSADEFYYSDPLFGSNKLAIPINQIEELVQMQSTTNRMQRNLLCLSDGSVYELMYQNYSVDKQAMFNALKQANSKIKLPANIWAYEQSRPQWAREVRKKMGFDE